MGAATKVYLEADTINEKCGFDFKMITGVITFTTYSTSGVSFDLSKLIPTKVHYLAVEPKGGYVAVYDYTNAKILVYEAGSDSAALDEVAANTDLSTTMADTRFFALGK